MFCTSKGSEVRPVDAVHGSDYAVDDTASSSSSSRTSVTEGLQHDGPNKISILEPKSKLDPGTTEVPSFQQVSSEKEALVVQRKSDSISPFPQIVSDRGLAVTPPPYDYANPMLANQPFFHSRTYGPSLFSKCHSFIMEQPSFIKMNRFWQQNRSYVLVILSTFFGSVMTLLTKLLEDGGNGMGPFQILFLRMVVTWVMLSTLLYFRKPSEFPWGPPSSRIRWLLLARGITGYFGLCGIWTSIQYLDLADATVITFLTPSLVAIFSAGFLHKPFTNKERLASLLAMLGVVFIARPAMIFGDPFGGTVNVPAASAITRDEDPDVSAYPPLDDPLDDRRSKGVLLALMSAFGGAGAFLAIRGIGHRASVLTTTNFFAGTCTLVTGLVFALTPLLPDGSSNLHFYFPKDAMQMASVAAITVCGLLTQVLLTAGIGGETRSNRAPAMTYTAMLWTAAFDRFVFGEDMYWSSIIGCALIVGGAVWMVLQPKSPEEPGAGDVEDNAGESGLELNAFEYPVPGRIEDALASEPREGREHD